MKMITQRRCNIIRHEHFSKENAIIGWKNLKCQFAIDRRFRVKCRIQNGTESILGRSINVRIRDWVVIASAMHRLIG